LLEGKTKATATGPTPTGEEEGGGGPEDGEEAPAARQKVKIKLADGKERTIQHMMATTFWSVDGRPMSAAEFITRLFGDLPELFRDEDELRALWGQPDTRKALLESLSEKGYGDEQLSEIRRMIDAEKSDLYDTCLPTLRLPCPPSRGRSGRMPTGSRYFPTTIASFRRFWILSSPSMSKKASASWIAKLPHLLELKYRAVSDAAAQLGGVAQIRDAFIGFQRHLYGG
jgi:type I restriction enzyme, R subunit